MTKDGFTGGAGAYDKYVQRLLECEGGGGRGVHTTNMYRDYWSAKGGGGRGVHTTNMYRDYFQFSDHFQQGCIVWQTTGTIDPRNVLRLQKI